MGCNRLVPGQTCEGGVARAGRPLAPTFARVYATLSMPDYSRPLLKGVQPALVAALGLAGGDAAAVVSVRPGSAPNESLTLATYYDLRGAGAPKAAAALAGGLRRNLRAYKGLRPFRVRVQPLVKVEVPLPIPAWLPPHAQARRVVNATLTIALSGLGRKSNALTPARRDLLVAGLVDASRGAQS